MSRDIEEQLRRIDEAAAFIAERLPKPDLAVVLGSGLGAFGRDMAGRESVKYADIPHFPPPTVAGHSGELIAGTVGGKTVYALSGRFHYYEGHDPWTVILPIRVLQRLGCELLIVTNAAGGINTDFGAGDLMLITDHINFTGYNPLRGPNSDGWGERFPDMSGAYDKELGALARRIAAEQGLDLKEGVYCGLSGPSFETPAEIRMLRTWGADAVGMSTVPEVLAARQQGMRVLGISFISNQAAGASDHPLSHQEVFEAAKQAEQRFSAFVSAIIERIEL